MAEAPVAPDAPAGVALRGSAWQVGSRVASIGLQAAAFALIARLLGPDALGGFAGAFALASLVGAAAEFGLQNTTVVELGRHPDRGPATLGAALVASTALGVAGILVAAPIAAWAFDRHAAVAFAALVPWAVVSRFSTPGAAWWQSHLDFRRIFLGEVAGRGSAVVGLAALLAVRPQWSVDRIVVVAGAILAVGAVVQFLAVVPIGPTRDGARAGGTVRGAVALVRIAAPLGVVSAISLVHVRSDQILLELLGHGGAELGAYSVAYRVVEGGAGVLGAVATVGFAILSRTAAADRARVSATNARVVAVVGLAGGLAVVVTAPLLVAVTGGAGFGRAVWPTRLLAVVVVISVLNMVPSLTLVAQRQVGRLVPYGVAVVVANVVLNLVLIPHLGATGSAVATIATELAGLAAVTWLAERALPGGQRPGRATLALVGAGAAAAGVASGSAAVGGAAVVVACAILAAMAFDLRRPARSAAGDAR